jgi:molybdate/tungstate transport system permease protein
MPILSPQIMDGARERQRGWQGVALLAGGLLLAYYTVPLAALFLGQSPETLLGSLGDRVVRAAALNSTLSASASTLVSVLLGVPFAYWLARTEWRGQRVLRVLVLLPLVLPPVVSGIVLVSFFGPDALGALVAPLGLRITRSLLGVVVAQTFVASPFVVITATAAFEAVDEEYEHAARTIGRGPRWTFRRVTLPLAWPGILAGITLTFARSIGEFGATMLVAYHPRTMPVQIWVSFVGRGLEAALALATILVGIAIVSLVVLNVIGGNEWGSYARL